MHVHFLDPYQEGASPIHRLDPRVKLMLTLAFILTVSLAPPALWAVYILLLAIALSVEIVSEIGVARVLRRSSLALIFVLAALPLVFSSGGNEIFAIPLGPLGALTVFEPGLERFASIALKSWISVQMAIVLSSTTSFPDLLVAMRGVRVPRLLVSIFGLMWRYLFVMTDEAGRLIRARASRSGCSEHAGAKVGGSIAWRARVTGGMAGNLFLRSFERGDRIYSAMAARGYNGEVRTLHSHSITPTDWAVLIAGLVLLALLLALSYLLRL